MCADEDGGVGNPSWCNRDHCNEKYGITSFYWDCMSIDVPGNPPNEACAYSTYKCERCMTFCDCKEMGYPLVLDSQCYQLSCPAGKVGKRIWKRVTVDNPTNPSFDGKHCKNQGRTLSCSECQCVSDMAPVSAVVNLDILNSLLEMPVENIENLNYLDLDNLKEQEIEQLIKEIKINNENK